MAEYEDLRAIVEENVLVLRRSYEQYPSCQGERLVLEK